SDWNLPTAPVQLTTKVESSPADLRQTPDWQGGLLIENQNIRAVVMKRSIVTLLPNASGPDRCYLRPAN
ncbi:hypothetical protein ACRCQ7_34660, partial [Pseudomonas aeruginosa]